MTKSDRRLIEDYLPLDDLNAIAAREKKHPRRYVELVHYWPARRPITASRAAVYGTLVAAPKSDGEREESATFVAKLAAFEPDPRIVEEATERIRAHYEGRSPKLLDMFAGGGAIPLEAARLGCQSYAIEYNPVAHLIELCTLVYPQTFGASLADDFRRWSDIILERMKGEIGDLYPSVHVPEDRRCISTGERLFGSAGPDQDVQTDPVTYIWARTVPCRRPGCDATVPLVRQAWLRKKSGAIASVPRVNDKNQLHWKIVSGEVTTRASYRQRVLRGRFEWPPEDCIPGWPWTGGSLRFGNRLRRTFVCGSIRRLSA